MNAFHKTLFLIHNFNSSELTESMMEMAETFLVKCLKPKVDLEAFDVLHLAAFNGNALKKDFERTPFASDQLTQENTKIMFSVTVVDTNPV